MIPLELATAAGGALIGGFLKLQALKMQAEQHKFDLIAGKEKLLQSGVAAAREFIPQGGAMTRRMIVMAVLFAVFIAPTLIAWFQPGTSIFYGYTESTRGFLFFVDSIEKMKFHEMRGLVILPVHTHLAIAIASFYFGAGIVKQAK